ncbi:MAG: right-handed parallel beta-helix repeat-containing protein [Myxococcota bacterium]|nr:right-handed parallel beta-helix repeat-containing protein [Myxococcota bacterium]
MARTPSPMRCNHPTTELRGTVTLQRGCYYEQSCEIDDPNTTRDCDGAELRISGEYSVNIKKNGDRAVVRNCYIIGSRGIAVRTRNTARNGETPDDVRALAASDVVLENLYISSDEHVGVHLLPHTVGVTVRNSILTGNSSSGIYMSPYGKNHRIINNEISNNGHTKPDGVPRIGWYRREGIAIDATSEHLIENNDITGNAFGGILLYKNCWEHAADNPGSRPRTEHASNNIIRNNRFGDQPFGIWVASRQSRDLRQMNCGDPTPYNNPIRTNSVFHPTYSNYPSAYTEGYVFSLYNVSIWPDFAEENVIQNNLFEEHSRGGIRVEDDETEVTGNLFIGDFDYIFVGAPFRARLENKPILDTNISNNSFHSPQGETFPNRLALIPDEHLRTILLDNYRACDDGNGGYMRHGVHIDVPVPANASSNCTNFIRICNDGTLGNPVPPPGCGMSNPDAGTSSPDAGITMDAGTPNMEELDGGAEDASVEPADAGVAPTTTDANSSAMMDSGLMSSTADAGVGSSTEGDDRVIAPAVESPSCASALSSDSSMLFILLGLLLWLKPRARD